VSSKRPSTIAPPMVLGFRPLSRKHRRWWKFDRCYVIVEFSGILCILFGAWEDLAWFSSGRDLVRQRLRPISQPKEKVRNRKSSGADFRVWQCRRDPNQDHQVEVLLRDRFVSNPLHTVGVGLSARKCYGIVSV
jgi:hypothetical protein